MALQKGINSYADVAEADAYFSDRIDAAEWVAADATHKAQALITATSMLDDLKWIGTVVSESQPLAFPRIGEYFDPRLGHTAYFEVVNIPPRITKATMEQAFHLVINESLLEDTGGVTDLTVSEINLTSIRTPSKLSSVALRMVTPMLLNNGSRGWWRAN